MDSIQTIIENATLDLKTIENFVNLPEGSDVRPRLLPSVDVGTLAGIRQAIFETGGLPATPFATKSSMSSSALLDNTYAMVTDDTTAANNGLYQKKAGVWVKSSYDPLTQANSYTDIAKTSAISTAATDATTKANTAKSEAVSASATDATTKANTAKSEAISASATDATAKANTAKSEAISAAATDATSKANAVKEVVSDLAKTQNKYFLRQKNVDINSNKSIVFSSRRGLPTWIEADDNGGLTDRTKGIIKDSLRKNILHQIKGSALFVVTSRSGRSVLEIDSLGKSNQFGGITEGESTTDVITFHGSSTMRKLQTVLFSLLNAEYPKITTPIYTYDGSGGYGSDLAMEIGINNGYMTFTDNVISASLPTNVLPVSLPYSLPNSYEVPIMLSNGVKGTIRKTVFTATNLVNNVSIPAGLPIYFESVVTGYAKYPSVLNLGKNDITSGAMETVLNNVIPLTEDAVRFLDSKNGGRTLVIGHTSNRGESTEKLANIKAVNEQLKARYLRRYFDLFSYVFSSKIWVDTELVKTSEDIAAIAAETLPPSFTDDGIHLNASANAAVAKEIFNFIKTLGWY